MVNVNGTENKLIYGVFTTHDNVIAGSAVCAFRHFYSLNVIHLLMKHWKSHGYSFKTYVLEQQRNKQYS